MRETTLHVKRSEWEATLQSIFDELYDGPGGHLHLGYSYDGGDEITVHYEITPVKSAGET